MKILPSFSSLFRYFLLGCLLIFSFSSTWAAEVSPVDSYVYLEDSDCPETQEWLEKQKKLFNAYNQANPYRAEIKSHLKRLMNHDFYTLPKRSGDHYFFKKIQPSEDQYVLYVQEGLEGTPRVLLDPNQLSKTHPVDLFDYIPSPDGLHVAYGLAENGSDWITWHVLDLASNETQADRVEKIKFSSVAWSPDSQGFYYARFDSETLHGVYYHVLGTSQSVDTLIYQDLQNPTYFYQPLMSSDGHYLILDIMTGSSSPNIFLCIDIRQPSQPALEILPYNDANSWFICNRENEFYFLTNKDAPYRKVVMIDIDQKPCKIEREIIPEGDSLLEEVVSMGNCFLACFLENVCHRLALYDQHGQWQRALELPNLGTVDCSASSSFHDDRGNAEFFFSFSHFIQPKIIYRYSLAEDRLEIFKQPTLDFKVEDFTIQQIFYPSKDGTQIPLFIVHKKGIKLDGHHPTLLYGYGGFGLTVYPSYSCFNMQWLEQGGVYVLANIRGGSEYGEEWHRQGSQHNKQNSFDDFIAAAEWLIANNYTQPSQLAIRGVSNGGLLVAACLNQRPELFGAAVAEVGVLDMLRFPLFTVGHFWMAEYGDPNNPDDAVVLYKYSPYHNIQAGIKYPPTLVVTSAHDDRVVPLHSYKYTAARQEAQGENSQILLRVDANVGHGLGKPISKWIEEATDILAFLTQELNSNEAK